MGDARTGVTSFLFDEPNDTTADTVSTVPGVLVRVGVACIKPVSKGSASMVGATFCCCGGCVPNPPKVLPSDVPVEPKPDPVPKPEVPNPLPLFPKPNPPVAFCEADRVGVQLVGFWLAVEPNVLFELPNEPKLGPRLEAPLLPNALLLEPKEPPNTLPPEVLEPKPVEGELPKPAEVEPKPEVVPEEPKPPVELPKELPPKAEVEEPKPAELLPNPAVLLPKPPVPKLELGVLEPNDPPVPKPPPKPEEVPVDPKPVVEANEVVLGVDDPKAPVAPKPVAVPLLPNDPKPLLPVALPNAEAPVEPPKVVVDWPKGEAVAAEEPKFVLPKPLEPNPVEVPVLPNPPPLSMLLLLADAPNIFAPNPVAAPVAPPAAPCWMSSQRSSSGLFELYADIAEM